MDTRFNLDDLPVSLRIGSIGAGLGLGCGIGIGFGQPLHLAAVPTVGQAVAGLSSGVGHISGFFGGAGTGVREVVRRLGVKGLDAGLGCGVGVGYGFGAGLFLKPSAAEQLGRLMASAAGSLARLSQAKLQEVGLHIPGGSPLLRPLSSSGPKPGFSDGPTAGSQSRIRAAQQLHISGNRGVDGCNPVPASPASQHSSPLPGEAGSVGPVVSAAWDPSTHLDPVQQQQQQPQEISRSAQQLELGIGVGLLHARRDAMAPPPSHGLASLPTGSSSPSYTASSFASGFGPVREPSAEEFRALLRHERQIAHLRSQNRALRNAVCKLDRRLPLCREKDDDGDGGTELW